MKKLVFILVALLLLAGCSDGMSHYSEETDLEYVSGESVGLKESNLEEPISPVVVTFPDANLEVAIREATGKEDGDIYASDLENLTILRATNRGIGNLTGIEYCTGLEFLYLNGNPLSDLSPLAELAGKKVEPTGDEGRMLPSFTRLWIGLSSCGIGDISALAGLEDIDELYLVLSDNSIEDLSPLENLTNLVGLYLRRNGISDISPLSGLVNLNNLELWGNQIEDISPLANLRKLSWAELSSNEIRDISPLARLTNLDSLQLGRNQISDISALADLTKLRTLYAERNEIADITVLANLTQLEKIDLRYNQITDDSSLDSFDDSVEIKLVGNPCTLEAE